jgi:hypothetical protein
VADDQIEDGVPEKFKPFIVRNRFTRVLLVAERFVGQRLAQQGRIAEVIANPRLQCLFAIPYFHAFSTENPAPVSKTAAEYT